jgi:AcrR family transcriptional regulator
MAAEPSRSPRWTRLVHDERREQILVCARRLFRDRPYAEVSMAEIADAAGVARGLLNHYFGTKRDLYLEAVREFMRVPPPPLPEEVEGRDADDLLAESFDVWLDWVERNRQAFFTATSGSGPGGDADVERIVDEAREAAAERIAHIVIAAGYDLPANKLQAAVRCFSGMAEETAREWLDRKRLSRDEAHHLLVHTLSSIVRDALPGALANGAAPVGATRSRSRTKSKETQ